MNLMTVLFLIIVTKWSVELQWLVSRQLLSVSGRITLHIVMT